MKKLLSLCIIALSINLAIAQSSFKGIVVDENDQPLQGATVVVKNSSVATVTNKLGQFAVNLQDGHYSFKVSFIGFETFLDEIAIPYSGEWRVKMRPTSVLTNEVIVSATRANSKSPIAFTEISKEELQSRNLGQDIPYLLNITPSVTTSSDAGAGVGYTGMRIRGTDMTGINVTVNGIPLNDAESHSVYWVDMPDIASNIENIQIQRGVGTSSNGAGAFGASINIQTIGLNKKPYVDLGSSLGSFETFKNNVAFGTGLLNDKFTFEGRLSKVSSAGYVDRASSDLQSIYVSGSYYHKSTLVKFNFISGTEKTYLAWEGIPSALLSTNRTYNPLGEYIDTNGNTAYYKNQTDNYKQTNYQLIVSHNFNSYFNFNAAIHLTSGVGFYEQYKQDDKFSKYGLPPVVIGGETFQKSDFIQQKWLDNSYYGTTYAFLFKNQNLETVFGGSWNEYDGDHFGKILRSKITKNVPYNYEWYRGNGLKKEFNSYLKSSYSMNSVHAYVDLQFRNINYKITGTDDNLRNIGQNHVFNFFNPKLGLSYDISSESNIYGSYSISNREPTRSNYTDADPNQNRPVSERLSDWEAGYNFKKANCNLSFNLFYMDYKDQLALTGQINDVGDPIMTNVSESYRLGAELTGNLSITKFLTLGVTATLSENKILNFTEFVDDWDSGIQHEKKLGKTDLAYSPKFTGSGILSFKPTKWFNTSIFGKYVGQQFIDNTSNSSRILHDYFVTNWNCEFNISNRCVKNASLKFQVNNIFNYKYESNAWVYRYFEGNIEKYLDGYFPQAGINFLAGLNLKF